MNCRTAEVALRATAPHGDLTSEPDLREHLSDCGACRRLAIELDPLTVFPLSAAPVVDDDEIEAMKHAVKTLRRTRPHAPRPIARARNVMATAAMLGALVLLVPTGTRAPEPVVAAGRVGGEFSSSLPLMDGLQSQAERVYELRSQGLSVVMIVDDSLEIDAPATSS